MLADIRSWPSNIRLFAVLPLLNGRGHPQVIDRRFFLRWSGRIGAQVILGTQTPTPLEINRRTNLKKRALDWFREGIEEDDSDIIDADDKNLKVSEMANYPKSLFTC